MADQPSNANTSRTAGSVREGVTLGLVLHLLGQSIFILFLTIALGGRIESAVLFAGTIMGGTQLPYMVPAIVDAAALRNRPRTARGLGVVMVGTLALNLLVLRALSPAGLF